MARNTSLTFADGRAESFIRISDSVFENLNYQSSLEVLSNLETNTVDCGDGLDDFFSCVFKANDH